MNRRRFFASMAATISGVFVASKESAALPAEEEVEWTTVFQSDNSNTEITFEVYHYCTKCECYHALNDCQVEIELCG